MHENKQNENEIVLTTINSVLSQKQGQFKYKIITFISKSKTKIKQYSLSIIADNQERKLMCRTPTKAKFILHELVSQIPLFWNYEKKNHYCLFKNQEEQKNYFKIKENFMKVLA